ncbi:hypothetical protein CBL_02921 [Carabus blaptoides fortunei]
MEFHEVCDTTGEGLVNFMLKKLCNFNLNVQRQMSFATISSVLVASSTSYSAHTIDETTDPRTISGNQLAEDQEMPQLVPAPEEQCQAPDQPPDEPPNQK